MNDPRATGETTGALCVLPLDVHTWPAFARLVEANNGVWGGRWCIGFHVKVGRGRTPAQNRAELAEIKRLRLLFEQGLVEHLPRRGARVTTYSARDFDYLFAVRDVLERFALSLVHTQRPEDLDTPDPSKPRWTRCVTLQSAATG